MRAASAVWDSRSPWASVARVLLGPASVLYSGITTVRNALYDRGVLHTIQPDIPVISVGNLAVGGTGKTPMAAWMASELASRGAHPAVVLRGYGDDERHVHTRLNPGVEVVTNPDRVAAVQDAVAAGADVAVLDDGFQHRRIARIEDVVLVSADRWQEPVRLLPAGPWRETPAALARASVVIVTRKAARAEHAASLMRRLAPLTGTGRGAVARFALTDLRDAVTGAARDLSDIRDARVLLAVGIADPAALAAQVRSTGAHVDVREFPDHHAYRAADIASLVEASRAFDLLLCTLKDAVKLGPMWPREGPSLWYVSVRCTIEDGGADVAAMLDRVLAARSTQLR